MILCQKCKKKLATVHLTEMQSGQRNETHLCEECARDMNLPHKQPITLNDLIGALMEKSQKKRSAEGRRHACPECGMRFQDFKEGGRLGCANDYDFFREELESLMKKVHGSTQYVGRVPRGREVQPVYENELVQLKTRLKKAIMAEKYEEAAKIRDRIKELEGLLEGESAQPEESGD